MKLIKHLFEGIGDYVLLFAWIISIAISLYFPIIWPLGGIFTVFIGLWFWMALHFWRKENQMFDRYKYRGELMLERRMEELQ